MKPYHFRCFVAVLLSALMMVSCWEAAPMLAGGGIGGTGIIKYGTIAAFGSIVVSGTEFDTTDAVIVVEGEEIGIGDEAILDNLDIGRVVTVEGTRSGDGSRFVADRVTYNDNVEGPVEGLRDIDASTKEIVVLGQMVVLNTVTRFKEVTFDTIALNDVVEVSGYYDDTGVVWATFIEKTGEFIPGLVVEVKGFVKNLNPFMATFKINDLTVDYSVADMSGLPGGEPAQNQLVEVEGTLDVAGGEMLATRIELGDDVELEDADEIEIMGFVTDFVSVFDFTVGNQLVQTDANTLFVDGTQWDLAPGVKLEAEGRLADGILYAHEIEFWEPDQIEVEGLVTDFVSVFEFSVGIQEVQTNAETVFVDGIPADIAVGVHLEIKGRLEGSILVADKVSFE